MNQTLRNIFFGTAASITAIAIPSEGAQAEPIITVTHPPAVTQMGGETTKQVDCGELIQLEYNAADAKKFGREKSGLYPSCEFVKQVDTNSQDICGLSKNSQNNNNQNQITIASLGGDTLKQKYASGEFSAERITNALSTVTSVSLNHLAGIHNDCVSRAGKLEARAGGNPNKVYGDDWQTRTSCSLVDALKSCKAAMTPD